MAINHLDATFYTLLTAFSRALGREERVYKNPLPGMRSGGYSHG